MEKIEIYIGYKIITYEVPYATARAVETLLKAAEHKTIEKTNNDRYTDMKGEE